MEAQKTAALTERQSDGWPHVSHRASNKHSSVRDQYFVVNSGSQFIFYRRHAWLMVTNTYCVLQKWYIEITQFKNQRLVVPYFKSYSARFRQMNILQDLKEHLSNQGLMRRNVKLASTAACQHQIRLRFACALCPCQPPKPSLGVTLLDHCLRLDCSSHLHPFPVLAPLILVLRENYCCPMKQMSSGRFNSSIFCNCTLHSYYFSRDYFPLTLCFPHPPSLLNHFHFFLSTVPSCSYLSPAAQEEPANRISIDDETTPVYLLLQPSLFSATL